MKQCKSWGAWGLVAGLAAVLVGSGILVAHGVQVGRTRLHWHPLDPPFWGRIAVIQETPPAENANPWTPYGEPEIGSAISLWWGAICVYTCPKPEDHRLVLYRNDTAIRLD